MRLYIVRFQYKFRKFIRRFFSCTVKFHVQTDKGGVHKQLKGSLSYYKVIFESIIRSALHFEALGLTNTVVVLLYGRFTQEQYNKAKKKNKIRPDYILEH